MKLMQLFLILLAVPAFAGTWNLDNSHSSIRFKVRHLMISNVSGEFKDYKVSLVTDDKDKPTALEATIEAKSINTGNDKRDEHLRNSDFFETEKHPQITFKTKKVTSVKKGNFKVVGDLTIRGVTKEATFDTTLSNAIKDPYGLNRRAVAGKTKINRKDYGISWNKAMDGGGVVVGDTVDVEVELEMTEAKAEEKKAEETTEEKKS